MIFLSLAIFSACAVLKTDKSGENQTLFTINEDSVTVDEFIYAFEKNRPEDSVAHKSEVDEYLELYKKFKLKVAEAKALGMDTTPTFRQEYSTYMSQLDNSYLQSSNDTDSLVRQAYDRMQYEVNASHILLLVEESAPAEDTLAAYNKLLALRDSIQNQGMDFGDMARRYSEDPSAKENKGNLGFFSVFQMVYPFENAAYNTKVGEISMPTRTRYGYHIVKVLDKRPNEGRVKVAHIMIRNAANAEERIFNIYDQLAAGVDWAQLCAANSEDLQSASRGGELAPFSRGQIVQPFADVAFSLTIPEEMSEPIQTQYGWHIIKLIERLPTSDFDKMEQQLSAQVRRDVRSQVSKQKMLDNIAIENNFIANETNIQKIIELGNHQFENGKFIFENDSLADIVLFSMADKAFIADSLYKFIDKNPRQQNSKQFLFGQFKEFKAETLINFEKSQLAEKYPEYKYLKKEYHDGILLFSIMEEQIWNPASTDSTGIALYYEQNKEKFIDSTTVEMAIFSSRDKLMIDSVRTLYPSAEAFLAMDREEKEALSDQNNDSTKVSLHLEFGELEIAKHQLLTATGMPADPQIEQINDDWYYMIPIRMAGEPRRLAYVRGRLIADYQDELEQKWITELAKKYPVNVDENALKFVYKKLDTQ